MRKVKYKTTQNASQYGYSKKLSKKQIKANKKAMKGATI